MEALCAYPDDRVRENDRSEQAAARFMLPERKTNWNQFVGCGEAHDDSVKRE